MAQTKNTIGKLFVTVAACGRCGKDHTDLGFTRLAKPIQMDGGSGSYNSSTRFFTHWSTCPETSEPVLIEITSTEEAR